MAHKRLTVRMSILLGLVLSVLTLTITMLKFVQAQEVSIVIVKGPDQTVVSGSTVTFTIAVTNTGHVTLTDVTVSDPLADNCNRAVGELPDLAPGAGISYECTRTHVTADFTNSAMVTGTDTVSDTVVSYGDEALVYVISPAIRLTKLAAPTFVNVGDTVNYTITVENTGDSDLSDVTVDEGLAGCALSDPDGDDGDSILEMDETWTYTCSVTAGDDDIVNTATVVATHEAGGTVSHSDTATVTVIHPAIEITKTADPTVVDVGDTVTYTVTVENAGDSDLRNVHVHEDLEDCTLGEPDGDTQNPDVLDLDETWTYTCTVTADSDDIVNTATVTATDEAGGTVSDWAQAEVDVIHPAIEIAKMPDVQTVTTNSTVTFTIAITNSGDVTLTNVTVSDARAPQCVAGIGVLARDDGVSYECPLENVEDGLINSATVTGRTPVGGHVTDSDAAKVKLDATLTCPNDMTAYWKLDETSGPPYRDFYYGREGNCAGNCPTPATGHFNDLNGAQAFDGQTTGIDVPVVPGDDSFDWDVQDSFSIEFWMKADSAGSCSSGSEVIVGRDSGPTSPLHWWVGIGCQAGGQAEFYLIDTSGKGAGVLGSAPVTDGAWHHVVAVRDASADKIRIHVDGVEQGLTSVTYTGGFDSPTAALNIGHLRGSFHFYGTVDEVALYDRELSADEIRQHHNEGLAGRWYCQAGKYAPIIVSTPVTEAVSGRPYIYDVEAAGNPMPTYMLNIRPNGMIIDPATGLISWTPTVAQEGSHGVEVQASNSEGTFSQIFTVDVHGGTICPEDMIAYWKLDEISGTTYYDFYDAQDGTCAGRCPDPTTGHVGGAQEFNGTDTGINVPADVAFDWGINDSLAIEFWLQTDSASTCAGNEVVVGREDSSTHLHWWVGCQDGGEAAFYMMDTGGTISWTVGTIDLTDGAWHHVVAVRDADANAIRIHVDGREEGSAPVTYAAGFDSQTAALNIGHLSGGYHFEGIVDEVALYNRVLSTAEIQQHFNNREAGPGYCINPGIAVAKAPNLPVVYPGSMVTYTYTVTNAGDAPLLGVNLSDDQCGSVTPPVGDDDHDDWLDPIETWIYRCSMKLSVDITNTATVTGSHWLGDIVSDTDTVCVDVISSGIAIDKMADPMLIYAGDLVTYTYTATNPGDDPLSVTRPSDDRCSRVTFVGGDDNSNYQLDPGEIWTYNCPTTVRTDITNTAIITGADSAGGTLTDTATISVDVRDSTLTIFKVANDDDAEFEFMITYGGNSEPFGLMNGESQQFADLAPGSYTIAEIVAPEWELLGITCTNDISLTAPHTPAVTITLESGQDVSCIFANYNESLEEEPYEIFLPIILKG